MPSHRIAPSAGMRQSLEAFLAEGIPGDTEPTSTLLRLAPQVLLQEALEPEQRRPVQQRLRAA